MNNWQLVPHKVVKNNSLKERLYDAGYAVADNIGADNVSKLKTLYENLHRFNYSEGGMFYSVYSSDIDYRRSVHQEIGSVMQPIYDNLFSDYKSVINSFIVKLSGPGSDFTLHQDSTGLDEFKYSPISVWVPLQDTNLENGALCIVPKTHRFFLPYRGISFAPPFQDYENLLRKYLMPIELKAGDIFLFDNRLVHYSHLNNSDKARVAVMSGIFPKEADILSIYKDENIEGSPIEVYKQTEDFLITNTAFYENCTERPYRGEVIQKIYEPLQKITERHFLNWAKNENLQPANILQLANAEFTMKIVSEPV